MAGGVDSGKSTLVAVLTHGADGRPLLDDGRGSARMAVFQHKHEIETGHTSSLTQQMLGYDTEGGCGWGRLRLCAWVCLCGRRGSAALCCRALPVKMHLGLAVFFTC